MCAEYASRVPIDRLINIANPDGDRSDADVAAALGVHPRTLYTYGRYGIPVTSILPVSKALGVYPEQIYPDYYNHPHAEYPNYQATTKGTRKYPYPELTPRQLDLVQAVVQGRTVPEAAAHLGIAYKTAESHMSDARRRLSSPSFLHVCVYAVGAGLVSFDPSDLLTNRPT